MPVLQYYAFNHKVVGCALSGMSGAGCANILLWGGEDVIHGTSQSSIWNSEQEHMCRIWTERPKVKMRATSNPVEIQADKVVMARKMDIVAEP